MWSGAVWRPCGPTTHKTAARLPRPLPARHRNLSYASGLPLSSRVARPWGGRPPSQERVGRVLGMGFEAPWRRGLRMRSGRVGRCGGRGSELVEYRIRSEHFRLAGSMFLSSPPCVCGAGTGEGGRPDWGAYACGVCTCAGRALAIYQRCLARPCGQRVFFSSDIMASTRAPPPVAPRRAADGGGGLHLGLLDVLVFMHSRHARPPA